MNIDDVNNILGYTGEKGAYYDSANYYYTPTKEVKTIAALESELGTTLSNRTTPDGKDLGTYYSDCYYINKTSDVKEMKNPGNVDLVYSAKNTYWLASPCVDARFARGYAIFHVRCVSSAGVNAVSMFDSVCNSYCNAYAVCPVVSLKSNIQLKQNTEKTAWEIKQAQN